MTIVTAGPDDLLYEFGPFVADPALGHLYGPGDEVPLTRKCFQVLIVLLDKHGQCVDKDELFGRVWPDTFVEQNNLARNISMIRKALHERDADTEFIVTVPGRGYRFLAPVNRVTRAALVARTSEVPTTTGLPDSVVRMDPGLETAATAVQKLRRLSVRARRVALAGAAIVLLFLLPGMSRWRPVERSADAAAEQNPQRKLWQLTSTGRLDGEPTWSPDGNRVAYSSDRAGNFDIWIQPVSAGTAFRLTSHTARDTQPAWSPDGHHLAFRSERNGGGLFVVAAEGGGERQITTFGHGPRWSPDGARILFWDSVDVYTVRLDGTPPSKVPRQAMDDLTGRFRIAWHPDGQRISIYGTHAVYGSSFWTFALDGGSRIRSRIAPHVAKRLEEAGLRLGNFVWGPGGNMLCFEGQSQQTENLWRIKVDPISLEWVDGPDRLTTGSSLERGLSLSPDGKRLAFGSRVERTMVWSIPFDAAAGRITGRGEPVTPDGANAEILDMSPDGRQLAYRVEGSNRHELWIRSIDRHADRLRAVEDGAAIVQPRWSRDGTQLAYLRRPSDRARNASLVILAADKSGGERTLRASRVPEMVYDWSADGRSLLVRCGTSSNRWAICRLPSVQASGPAPDMRIVAADSRQSLYAAKNSPDGRWVSFIARPDMTRSTVFVSPAEGGPWIALTDGRYFEDKPRWSPDGRTLYFLSNRSGFWNLWGRRFDSHADAQVGDLFQVSHFDSSVQMIRNLADLQIGITRERLILPLTQASGAVWVLDNVDR